MNLELFCNKIEYLKKQNDRSRVKLDSTLGFEGIKEKQKDHTYIVEAIMINEQYDVFKKFNQIVGHDLIAIPETFLPDLQMKIQRQKAMNNVLDINPEQLDKLSTELSKVHIDFENFKILVDTIKKLEEKVDLIKMNEGNDLIINEDDILEYIKNYLFANEIAEQFISSMKVVRQTPFFEDYAERAIKYQETLIQMLKKRLFGFATIEESCLTINYKYLQTTICKFSTLNLGPEFNELYTDLNSKIMKFMLNATILLFETSEEDGSIKKYHHIDDGEEGIKIMVDSSVETIREYVDIFQNNAEKYYQVIISMSKIIATPIDKKLEELQDYLENKMEILMKATPEHFKKQVVIDILKKFDDTMNKLNDVFVFDMKGMAENIETIQLEEILKQRLLSLKKSMYSSMKQLQDCQDNEDYNIFKEIILAHFLFISEETQKVVEKRKGNQNKRGCLDVIVMNYQLFSNLIEVFETDTDNKSLIHYNYLVDIVKTVKEYFLSFIDLDAVQKDDIILQKAIQTLSDIQLLEIQLSDLQLKYS